jgi:VWFA-related protein
MPLRTSVFIFTLAAAAAQAPAPPSPADTGMVLHFDVNLVQVDAVVTDSKGGRVSGLRAEDFEVLQDGRPQTITNFSYSAGRQPDAAASTAPVADPSLTRNEVRRTFVLILDDANMAFGDFHYVQEALLRFADKGLENGDMAAVVRTSVGSGTSQLFTSDRQWLHRTIERMVWRPPLAICSVVPPLPTVLVNAIRALADFPGRKSILLISPGSTNRNWYLARMIADFANRSSVTIEAIDARSLPTLAPSAVTHSGDGPSSGVGMFAEYSRMRDLTAVGQRLTGYINSQDVLAFLANMTAGRFLHDKNDMYGQLKAAADDSEAYYLMGWYPGPGAFVQKPHQMLDYHHIQIRVRGHKDLTVRTRDGFFARPSGGPQVAFSPARQMSEALFSPFRTGDIDVRLTASVGYDDTSGAYVDSLLRVLPRGVVLHEVTDQPGCKTVDLEIVTTPMPLDPSQEPREKIAGEHPVIRLCGKGLEGFLAQGLVVSVRDRTEAPGAYQMRVAVRNMTANDAPTIGPQGLVRRDSMTPERTAIGSASEIIEVPDLKRDDFALTGITLWGEGGTAVRPASGTTVRPLTPGDPAVRQFHGGETVKYVFRLVRDPKRPPEATVVQIKVAHDGKDVFASEPRPVQTGETVEGWYKLDSSLEPGQYLIGVQAKKSGSKSAPMTQWIDFEVTR